MTRRGWAALLVGSAIACACGKTKADEACEALEKTSWSVEQVPAPEGACPADAPPMRDLSDRSKLAVSVYHFNIQYVAGGLSGFPDNTIVDKYNLDEKAVEDVIVRAGLEPVLDMYLAHPSFRADIELQAYMVEVIAARHPDVLAKMRTLAATGQIDFDSFHYSDELFIAYPKRDLEVSLDLVDRIFARVCLPRGRSIFAQEGQFARGELPIAREHGYQVAVLPKNLFSYQVGEDPAKASVLYDDPELQGPSIMIGGAAWSSMKPFDLVWTFMNDGEVAFTVGGLNPYFGKDYQVDPGAVAKRVEELMQLEQAGFVHATIAEAAAAMKRMGFAPARLPPVFDGTWQPKDTGNVHRWMGGAGLFRTYERDSDLLATVWNAGRLVRAAEQAMKRGASRPSLDRALAYAWREALFSEVSDSTGWNPWRTEVEYSFAHAKKASDAASNVLACLGASAPSAQAFACDRPPTSTLEALGVEISAPARQITSTVHGCAPQSGSAAGEVVHEVVVAVTKLVDDEHLLDQTDQESNERHLEVRFQRTGDLASTLALEEQVRTFALDGYVFDSLGVVLPLGLVSLGPSRWLIQDLSTGRLAAIVSRTGADKDVLRFVDDTVSRAHESTRRWYVVEGAPPDRALGLARSINGP
jgi:hypothetical protein